MTQQTTTAIAMPTIPEEIAIINEQWVEGKELELANARYALQMLEESGASSRKMRRIKERVGLLVKVVEALKKGCIIIPRFDTSTLRIEQEELPLKAIIAINEAKAKQVFDDYRIVMGREARNQGNRRRMTQRDPLIVGINRTPVFCIGEDHDNKPRSEYHFCERWSLEEHFLIAWWRPEDERMEDMF